MNATRDWFYQLPPVDLGDRCLHVGPISHGSGYLFQPVWLGGGCNILYPRFDAQTVLEALSAEPVSYFFAVPTMVADLTRMAGGQRLDLPALKAVMVSGAPISERTALAGHEVFGDTMYQMYGQTEAVPVTFMGPRPRFSPVPRAARPVAVRPPSGPGRAAPRPAAPSPPPPPGRAPTPRPRCPPAPTPLRAA